MTLLVIAAAILILAVVILGLVSLVRRAPKTDERPDDRAGRTDTATSSGATAVQDEDTTASVESAAPATTEAAVAEPVAEPVATPEVERPERAAGRMTRLRARLARSQSTLGKGLLTLLSRDRIDEETWEEIEDTLISADIGVAATQELVERLRTRVRVEGSTVDEVRQVLREELLAVVGTDVDRSLSLDGSVQESTGATMPAVVMVVGVNGTGKTTTVGKLARVLVAEESDVVLGAADTFRAAAVDQLATWGDRVGVPTVRGEEGADPASVAYESVRAGIDTEASVVLVDTAGRLHTKTGLMDELGKVKRVIEKQAPVSEVLLVIDATTGQNGLTQARVFSEVVAVTGVVLTKLDSTAKGGIIVAIQRELDVPVKLVGLGEGPDDLAPFEPETFVDALLA